jgi:hypothetical protein
MELSTIQEANSCAATQTLPSILWNPKVLSPYGEFKINWNYISKRGKLVLILVFLV